MISAKLECIEPCVLLQRGDVRSEPSSEAEQPPSATGENSLADENSLGDENPLADENSLADRFENSNNTHHSPIQSTSPKAKEKSLHSQVLYSLFLSLLFSSTDF